jgi:hypothetical protein
MERFNEAQDVELDPPTFSTNFFIDQASSSSLFLTALFLLCLIVFQFYACLALPSPLVTDEKVIHVGPFPPGPWLRVVSLNLTGLEEDHRFFSLTGALISTGTLKNFSVSADILVRVFISRDGCGLKSYFFQKKYKLAIADVNHTSSPFDILRIDTQGGDRLEANFEIGTQYDVITGYVFKYQYANAAISEYFTLARWAIAGFLGYV